MTAVRTILEALQHHGHPQVAVRPSTGHPGLARDPDLNGWTDILPPFGLDDDTLERDVAYIVVVYRAGGLPPGDRPRQLPGDAGAGIPTLEDWDPYL